MGPVWWAVIASFVGVLATVVGWSITYGYQKKLLEQQATMQKEAQAREAALRQLLSEHDTRFSFLHTRRGQVLEELYKHLSWALSWLQASTSALRLGNEELPEVQQARALREVQALAACYNETRPFLHPELCKQMDGLLSSFTKAFLDLGLAGHFASFMVGPDPRLWEQSFVVQRTKLLQEVGKFAYTDLPKMRESIELQIREILEPHREIRHDGEEPRAEQNGEA